MHSVAQGKQTEQWESEIFVKHGFLQKGRHNSYQTYWYHYMNEWMKYFILSDNMSVPSVNNQRQRNCMQRHFFHSILRTEVVSIALQLGLIRAEDGEWNPNSNHSNEYHIWLISDKAFHTCVLPIGLCMRYIHAWTELHPKWRGRRIVMKATSVHMNVQYALVCLSCLKRSYWSFTTQLEVVVVHCVGAGDESWSMAIAQGQMCAILNSPTCSFATLSITPIAHITCYWCLLFLSQESLS